MIQVILDGPLIAAVAASTTLYDVLIQFDRPMLRGRFCSCWRCNYLPHWTYRSWFLIARVEALALMRSMQNLV